MASGVRRHARDLIVPSKVTPAALRNLGPRSEELLASVGITTVAQLRGLGSVAGYARVRRAQSSVSLNLLWALEGAITDLPWQVVARELRTSLLLALGACRTWSVESENRRERGQFLPNLQPHSRAMGQKGG